MGDLLPPYDDPAALHKLCPCGHPVKNHDLGGCNVVLPEKPPPGPGVFPGSSWGCSCKWTGPLCFQCLVGCHEDCWAGDLFETEFPDHTDAAVERYRKEGCACPICWGSDSQREWALRGWQGERPARPMAGGL